MSKKQNQLRMLNGSSVLLESIPILAYNDFFVEVMELLKSPQNHCVSYYAMPTSNGLQFFMAVADDEKHDIVVLSHLLLSEQKQELESLTQKVFALHIFEREIHENYGVAFLHHPWQKPVRYAHNRADQNAKVSDYPFYSIASEELHEVGVGPVHAGIIEPGHFRFICNGENVLHLEIQLGWQHRGVEKLFLDTTNNLKRNLLAENIAGDTPIGHATTFAQTMEALAAVNVPEQLHIERAMALELERIAILTGDISALCVDAAYKLGADVFGILRTAIVNFLQYWCGNRFGKSLIRIGGTNFTFTETLKLELSMVLDAFEKKFEMMAARTYRLPSIQNRFENVGTLTLKQVQLIGAVGPSARMAGLKRDIRISHPRVAGRKFPYQTITSTHGDVFIRFLLKKKEIRYSIAWLRNVMANYPFCATNIGRPDYKLALQPNRFAISLNEGWRGEICHCAITDTEGELLHYKIKDPSMHNWKALELSLRNEDISDFPINNKSYNLSYCGHDL